MTVGAIGGTATGWSAALDDAAAAPSGGAEVAAANEVDPGEPSGIAERALEVVAAAEAENADDAVHNAGRAVRQGAQRRIDARAKIRELVHRLEEAQRNQSIWQKITGVFKWLGTALAAVAGVALTVATCGAGSVAAVAGTVALAASLGGAASGAGGALATLGERTYASRGMGLEADRLVEDDAVRAAEDGIAEQEAFAQAIVETEEAMRQQALSWMANEDAARRVAVSAAVR
jgi:hypothetical protein